MSQRVFITGFGIITSIGNNAEENFRSLTTSRHGYGPIDFLDTVHRTTIRASEIKLDDKQLADRIQAAPAEGFTRTAMLGLIAAQEAIQSAGLSAHELHSAAFLSATTTGGIREYEKYFRSVQDLTQQGIFEAHTDTANPGEHTERIADRLGIKGYLATVSTACSSSANTIMQGARLIKNSFTDRAICGGAEALSKFTINGFNSLLILDKDHCRPFDISRSGLNLGEGAAYVVLESETALKKSGKKPLAEVLGYGNANDSFHQTASSPEGTGAYLAMRAALDVAGIQASQIDYVNAHGTATENNDMSEAVALARLFDSKVPDFSSTKPYTGHTLAAAGSIEASFCIMALQHGVVFPNLNFRTPMAEVGISPITEMANKPGMKYTLSNSFGFGGNTSSLLIGGV